jgi:pimeloyl-ACP methyl ester carboxylesterase
MGKWTRRELLGTLPLVIPAVGLSARAVLAAGGEGASNKTTSGGRKVKHVHTSFGDIAYSEKGEGKAALFLHGAFLNGYQWRHVVDRVADVRRTLAVDLMAHGATKIADDQAVSFADQADMVEAVCKELKLDQVDLVANDSGGGIAQIFAARHPERIRTLTLSNCDTHDNWPGPTLERLKQLTAEQLGDTIRRWLADVNVARTTFAVAYEHPEKISEETFRTYFRPLVETQAAVRNLKRFFDSADNRQTVAVEPQLKRLRAPTLIIWAMKDTFFDAKWAGWLRDTIPGTRKVVEVEGAKIFFPEERSKEFADALRQHWREADGAKGT